MAFKYRLETSLRLASQEMNVALGVLADELKNLHNIRQERDSKAALLARGLEEMKKACLGEPYDLRLWQEYLGEVKKTLLEYEDKVREQESVVAESREKVIRCRIKAEKFKRLKQKKWKLYNIEEQKKEQAAIDEIPQGRFNRR